VNDLVHNVLNEIALLLEELDLALAVLGGQDVYDVRQRVEPRRSPPLIDPREAFREVLRHADHQIQRLAAIISDQHRIHREKNSWERKGRRELTDLSDGMGRPSKMPRRAPPRLIVPAARVEPTGEVRDLANVGRGDLRSERAGVRKRRDNVADRDSGQSMTVQSRRLRLIS
jgi:hypothetical protein